MSVEQSSCTRPFNAIARESTALRFDADSARRSFTNLLAAIVVSWIPLILTASPFALHRATYRLSAIDSTKS